MKWFKHMTDSGDDPDLDDSFTLFKANGPYVFWRTLEIMNREFDIKNPGKNTFSVEFFRKKYRISYMKVLTILTFFQKRERIFYEEIKIDQLPSIRLNCPKAKELADEYTQKQLAKMSGPRSGPRSGQAPEQETETETEGEKENIKTTGQAPAPGHYENRISKYLDEILYLRDIIFKLNKKALTEKVPGYKNFNVDEYIQKYTNEGYHPGAIFDCLKAIINKWGQMKRGPWAYTRNIIKTLNGNYYEQEHIAEAAQFKNDFFKDDRVKNLLANFLKGSEI